MTLFETAPQLTMFVLFFMLGFVTRFFAKITMLLFGTAFRIVGTRVVFICQKVLLKIKAMVQTLMSTARRKQGEKIKRKAIQAREKEQNAEAVHQRKVVVGRKKKDGETIPPLKMVEERAKKKDEKFFEEKATRKAVQENENSPKSKALTPLKMVEGRVRQKNNEAFFWDVIYFGAIGVLTLKVFLMFEYVDFFWFIPLSVILGVTIHDYLTKEVFAKRKKV